MVKALHPILAGITQAPNASMSTNSITYRHGSAILRFPIALTLAFILLSVASPFAGARPVGDGSSADQEDPSASATVDCSDSTWSAPFIPVDSWIYPAVLRLYSLGFLDHVFLGMRPWTWDSLKHMLEDSAANIDEAREGPVSDEARKLYKAVHREINRMNGSCPVHSGAFQLESTYTIIRALSGSPLRDSFHLGSTVINDYGRPYESGFNSYTGASGSFAAAPLGFYIRGEFESAPSAAGYPAALGQTLAEIDETVNPVTGLAYPNQATIPLSPIAAARHGRFLEAYVCIRAFNHVLSFGKQDEWLGPAQGASMAYSNNAESFYALHINRIEPLYVPGLSRFTGPFRYEFLVGALRGHTLMPNPNYPGSSQSPQPNVINPGDPWVHVEKISFRPTDNLEFGFERTALFGGEGHSPVTLHTFLRSFFSLTAPQGDVKDSRNDPGARFGAFDVSYRLPFVRNWLTLYLDSEVHDDVSPISAPQRSSVRPGLYLSHVPKTPKLAMRLEAAMTDPAVTNSQGGRFMYWEGVERQGYTNQGQLFGDWIGREDKGGQGWITWHLGGNEWMQASVRNQKAAKDFIPGGTTLNDLSFQAVKRIHRDFEVNAAFSLEHWKAPVYLPGTHTVTATTLQFTWYPERKTAF